MFDRSGRLATLLIVAMYMVDTCGGRLLQESMVDTCGGRLLQESMVDTWGSVSACGYVGNQCIATSALRRD
jgi:hypothetical protein